MGWLAVDKDGKEYIYEEKPYRITSTGDTSDKINGTEWCFPGISDCIELPKGSIQKLIGKELTWNDEPVVIMLNL